jgi:hypothetical protein
MAIKTAIKVGTYYIVVLFAVALAAAETMRPVASLHGHQNKAATEVHLFVADTFLLGVIVAKDHVMAH